MGKKIIDQFTDLPISYHRKWALRHPEGAKAVRKKYHQTEKYKKWLRSEEVVAKRHANDKKWRLANHEYDVERKRQYHIKKKLAKEITNHE